MAAADKDCYEHGTSSNGTTTIGHLPDVILSNIIAAVSDVRSRNAASLVCHKWRDLERSTRTSLVLRGNVRNLFDIPICFRSVTHLDLSNVSPWGHSLLSAAGADPSLTAILLRQAFPLVTSLTIYARHPTTLEHLAPQWPNIQHIKLVRWHQRPQMLPGSDLTALLGSCSVLSSLDLSSFYCWTDDVPPALQSLPLAALRLTKLNLLNPYFAEGFKAQEIEDITKACPNLREFLAACMFDPRYIGFVGGETLLSIAANCRSLSVFHLADTAALLNVRADPNNEGFSAEDARISPATLIEVFAGLPMLEEFVLDLCNNVRDSGPAFEALNSKCPKLRSLKLGQFHGICAAIGSKLDGIALCQRLESLSIRNCGNLTDMGLIAIARGCSRLEKLAVQGCKKITVNGMGTLAYLLSKTLVDVKISCCKNLGAVSSLKALQPIQDRILRLHIDCVWDSVEQCENLDGPVYNFDLNKQEAGTSNQDASLSDFYGGGDCEYDDRDYKNKRRKFSYDLNDSYEQVNCNGNGVCGMMTWDRLQYLSLWIGVGELLTPLATAGLANCPSLEEIRIKVEGDCREWSRPSERAFGLSCLVHYPKLSKMHLDCGDTIGYAQTAPSGQMDLSLWERFYLLGIGSLRLSELDYWPPQDRDVNQRSLFLPAGLLQECATLRKLFIHGTANEHFMMFFLRIPGLRDVQLREDYYPAPENDMSTEMRADSCSRFEDSLNGRIIPD